MFLIARIHRRAALRLADELIARPVVVRTLPLKDWIRVRRRRLSEERAGNASQRSVVLLSQNKGLAPAERSEAHSSGREKDGTRLRCRQCRVFASSLFRVTSRRTRN